MLLRAGLAVVLRDGWPSALAALAGHCLGVGPSFLARSAGHATGLVLLRVWSRFFIAHGFLLFWLLTQKSMQIGVFFALKLGQRLPVLSCDVVSQIAVFPVRLFDGLPVKVLRSYSRRNRQVTADYSVVKRVVKFVFHISLFG